MDLERARAAKRQMQAEAAHEAAMVDWPRNISDAAIASWLSLASHGIFLEAEKASLLYAEASRRLAPSRPLRLTCEDADAVGVLTCVVLDSDAREVHRFYHNPDDGGSWVDE